MTDIDPTDGSPLVDQEGPDQRDAAKPAARWGGVVALAALGIAAAGGLLVIGPFRDRPSGDVVESDEGRAHLAIAIAPLDGPDVEPRELAPVVEHLSKALSVEIDLTRARTTRDVFEALGSGDADLALLPALACVQAQELDRGVRLLVVQSFGGSYSTDGLLVTRSEAHVDSIEGLRGRGFCFADRSSTSYLLAVSWLRGHGRDPAVLFGQLSPFDHQLAALRQLVDRRTGCDAVAISEAALDAAPSQGVDTEGVSIFARTGHVPLSCWAASSHADDRLVHLAAEALVSFDAQAETGGTSVGQTARIEGFRAVDGSTYRAVRLAARFEGLLRP